VLRQLSYSKQTLYAAHLSWPHSASNNGLIYLRQMFPGYVPIWSLIKFESWVEWCLVAVACNLLAKLLVQLLHIAILDDPKLACWSISNDTTSEIVVDVTKAFQSEPILREASNSLNLVLRSRCNNEVVHIDHNNCSAVQMLEETSTR
jgi:hypothetical protein